MDNTKKKKIQFLKNISTSVSDSLLRIFSNSGIKAEDLLAKAFIIKSIRIGLSYLSEENKPTILNQILKGEALHSSIYFGVESTGKKTGVIVQYGKYEYIKKEEIKKELKDKVTNIGFPYNKEGGLMFAELDSKKFKEIYCSAGVIRPRINPQKGIQLTIKSFIDKVKEINGPWTLANYDPHKKSCQDFIAAALQVINPDYEPEQDKDDDLKDEDIPIVIREELDKHKK